MILLRSWVTLVGIEADSACSMGARLPAKEAFWLPIDDALGMQDQIPVRAGLIFLE